MPRQKKGKAQNVRQKPLRTPAHLRVCEYLRDARLNARLTQGELAEKIGWRQGDISKIETGERRIDVVEMIEFAYGVGFDPGDLVRNVVKVVEETRRKARRHAT